LEILTICDDVKLLMRFLAKKKKTLKTALDLLLIKFKDINFLKILSI